MATPAPANPDDAPAVTTMIDIPLDSAGNATTAPQLDADGLPPRGRGVSRAVADVLQASGKPVKATLAGCRLAGCLLKFSTLALLVAAGLLFWGSSLTRSDVLLGVLIAIGIFCVVGSCLSCYGAVQLAWYRALVQRANDTLDRGADVVTRVGSGESATSVARDLVDPEVIAGRMGGRVLRMVGMAGKNAERATQVATELNRIRKSSAGGSQQGAEAGAAAVAGGAAGADAKV